MKQGATNKKFLISFYHFKPNLLIIGITFILLICAYYFLLRKNDLVIFPNNNTIKFEFFDDKIVGGNSKILPTCMKITCHSLLINILHSEI